VNSLARLGIRGVATLAVTFAAAWATWPAADLELRVDRGGRAVVVHRWGRNVALPETLVVKASGRNTTIRLDNRDTTYQTLGILGAPAKSVRTFALPLPGTYGGFCSAHPESKQLTYLVQ
jgi:hypothetical protein